MKTIERITATSLLLAATALPARAEFLVLKVRETTAERVWTWIVILAVLLVALTIRATRNKGGQGR